MLIPEVNPSAGLSRKKQSIFSADEFMSIRRINRKNLRADNVGGKAKLLTAPSSRNSDCNAMTVRLLIKYPPLILFKKIH